MSTNDPARRNRAVPVFTSYSLTVLLVAAATALRWGLGYAFGPIPPFLTFFPALMLAALIWGLGPGLAATALGGLAADYCFIPPIGSLRIANPGDGVALALFSFIGASISVIAYRLRQARAEQVTRENEQRWATVLASIGDAVIATDVSGRITFINPVAESLTGWTRREASMKPVTEILNIVNEQTRQQVENPITKVLREGMVVGLANHTILVRRDGTEVPIDDSGAPIRDRDGKTTGVVLVFRDITDRKRADEAVQTTLQRLHIILSSMYGGLLLVADEGRVEFANQAICDYFALNDSPADLVGFTSSEIFAKISKAYLYPDEAIARIKEIVYRGQPVKNEEVPMTSGRELLRDFIPIHINGKSYGRLWCHTDITERKKMEEELRKSQRLLRDIIDSSPSAIFLKDRDGKFITINKPLEKMLGVTPEELEGKTDYDIASRDVADYWRSHDEQVMKTGLPMQIEEVADLKDGHHVFLANKFPLVDALGRIYGVCAISHDITERKKAEVALQETKSLLQAITDHSPDPIFVKDRESRITFGNPALLAVWGRPLDEVIGKDDRQLYDDHAVAEAIVANDRMIMQSGRSHAIEEVVQTKDGLRIYLSTKTPYRDDKGDIAGLVGIARDITERKKIENELQESKARLDLALESASMGAWHWDLVEDRRSFDDQVCRLLGIEPATFTGTADEFFDVVHPDDREMLKAALALTIEQDVPYEPEYRAVWPDGSVHYIAARGRLARHDANNKPQKINGIIWDITERKRIEEDLLLSEEKFALAFASNAAAIAMTRLEDGLFLEVNDTWVALNGYSREEVIGCFAREMHIWPTTEASSRFVQDLREKGSLRGLEQEFLKKSGEVFVTQLSAQILTLRSEKVILSTFVDVTERKRAEEAVRESRAMLQAALASMTDAVFISDADGNFIEFNDAFATFHKFRSKNECAKTFAEYPDILDVYLPDGTLAPVAMWAVPRALRGETATNAEYVLRRKDTGETWVGSYSFGPIRDKDGHIVGSVTVGRDITERKAMERELQKARDDLEQRVIERTEQLAHSEKEFRLLAEAMPQIVWITRADGWNIYFNQQWVDYTGLTLGESYGHGWNKPFHPDDQQRAWDAWQNAVTNNGTYSLECRLRAADGTYRWWLVRGVPVVNEKGETTKWFGTCTDIEEIKRTEEEVWRYASQLELSNRELQDFAFVASHDLQEPLRKIQAFGDQLKIGYGECLDAEGLDYLSRMQNAAVRMQALIHALLNYSRVTTKARPFSITDLATVAREVVGDLEGSIIETGGRAEIGDLPKIESDPVQMRQLFQNLIGNALKFHGDEKPMVKIYGRPAGGKKTRDGKYLIFVEDNGIGFDEKYLDRIFTPFQRLHGRGTYEGTGIGLAICRKIV
ncbi:MAG: PAS domain S-box protein, partial [Syntrophorhabdales bacterium]